MRGTDDPVPDQHFRGRTAAVPVKLGDLPPVPLGCVYPPLTRRIPVGRNDRRSSSGTRTNRWSPANSLSPGGQPATPKTGAAGIVDSAVDADRYAFTSDRFAPVLGNWQPARFWSLLSWFESRHRNTFLFFSRACPDLRKDIITVLAVQHGALARLE